MALKVKVMIVAFKSSVHQHRTHDLAFNSKSEDGIEDLKHKFDSIGPMTLKVKVMLVA